MHAIIADDDGVVDASFRDEGSQLLGTSDPIL